MYAVGALQEMAAGQYFSGVNYYACGRVFLTINLRHVTLNKIDV